MSADMTPRSLENNLRPFRCGTRPGPAPGEGLQAGGIGGKARRGGLENPAGDQHIPAVMVRRPGAGAKILREDVVMKRAMIVPVLVFAGIGLAGCGYSPGSRALSGGAIGAGTGAIIGAATGMGPGTGALIGGGVGAIGGAVTNPNTVNLGKPLVGN